MWEIRDHSYFAVLNMNVIMQYEDCILRKIAMRKWISAVKKGKSNDPPNAKDSKCTVKINFNFKLNLLRSVREEIPWWVKHCNSCEIGGLAINFDMRYTAVASQKLPPLQSHSVALGVNNSRKSVSLAIDKLQSVIVCDRHWEKIIPQISFKRTSKSGSLA